MLNAQCWMLNGQCSTVNVQCSMFNGHSANWEMICQQSSISGWLYTSSGVHPHQRSGVHPHQRSGVHPHRWCKISGKTRILSSTNFEYYELLNYVGCIPQKIAPSIFVDIFGKTHWFSVHLLWGQKLISAYTVPFCKFTMHACMVWYTWSGLVHFKWSGTLEVVWCTWSGPIHLKWSGTRRIPRRWVLQL